MMKMLIVVLIIAGIVPFALPLKDGKPLLKWSDISMPKHLKVPSLSDLPDIPDLPDVSDLYSEPSDASVTVYKWKDTNGNWHFGDSPPAGVSYESVSVNPAANVIQAPEPRVVRKPVSGSVSSETVPSSYSPASVYNPAKVKEMMGGARNVGDVLQQRKAQQDRQTSN